MQIDHIMYDGYQGEPKKMDDLLAMHEVIEAIAEKINAPLLNPPYLLPYFTGKVPEDKGVSGVALLEGGHITFHNFSDDSRLCVFADVMSTNARMPADFSEFLKTTIANAFGTRQHYAFDRASAVPATSEKIRGSFGPHLMMTGRLRDEHLNMDWLYDFMQSLPPKIGMTPITTPLLTRTDDGIDGLLVIAESHASTHVNPSGEFVFDLFSCKDFDVMGALDSIRANGLTIDEESVSLTARGEYFPR